jgi:hypothetical protein
MFDISFSFLFWAVLKMSSAGGSLLSAELWLPNQQTIYRLLFIFFLISNKLCTQVKA